MTPLVILYVILCGSSGCEDGEIRARACDAALAAARELASRPGVTLLSARCEVAAP